MQSVRTDVGTLEDLHASATRLTGLDDFGEDDYRGAMGTLLHTERNRYGPFGWDRKPETHVWAIDTTAVPVRRADGAGEGT